jgi:iron complex outermembrane recepter protein
MEPLLLCGAGKREGETMNVCMSTHSCTRRLAFMALIAVIVAIPAVSFGDTPSPATDVSAQTSPATDAEVTGTAGSGVLEEVTVTATKQTQSLQKTPAAVTVLSGDSLTIAGITDIRAAQDFVPSVRFQAEGTSTEIYIRGVGGTLDDPQVEPPTSFNFNGIYVPREATSVPLYDVEQIEVLPGPQGTLYGRSSLGGAVNVNFNRPTKEYQSGAELEAGNYSLVHISAVQNVPIGDTFAVRLAIDDLQHRGYQPSGADSQRDFSARLAALYEPTDQLSIYLWDEVAALEGHPQNSVVKGVNPTTGKLDPNAYLTSNPWNDQFSAPYAAGLPFGQPAAEHQGYSNNMVGGELNVKLGPDIKVTDIPSYLDVTVSPSYWLSAFPANLTVHYNQWTNELRASGTESWGSWLAGLYAYRLQSSGIFSFGGFTPATALAIPFDVDLNRVTGQAGFGQVTLNVVQDLRLTLGGRYSHDHRVGYGNLDGGAALTPFTYDHTFSHVDYKVGLDYDIAPGILLYSAVQTAYQPGTFNGYASTPTYSNAVGSANLRAYSAGEKSRLFGDRLQVNDEVFYYDYRGLFASAYNTITNEQQTFNAQKTEILGNQLDLIYKVTNSDQIKLSAGYLNARNIRFELPDGSANYDGYQLQYAPDWTVTASYAHDLHFESGYLRASASSRYEDSFYADFGHTPGGRQQPYHKSDASLTYYSERGGWSLGVWVKNIENVAVIAATAGGSTIPPLATGATPNLESPRTFGMRATWNH